MPDRRQPVDVELRCSACGYEKLATEGCWLDHCSQCGKENVFVVTKRHDKLLSLSEADKLGYKLVIR